MDDLCLIKIKKNFLFIELNELESIEDLDEEILSISKSEEFKNNKFGVINAIKSEKNYMIRQINEDNNSFKELTLIGLVLSLFALNADITLKLFEKIGLEKISVFYMIIIAVLIFSLIKLGSNNNNKFNEINTNIKKLDYIEFGLESGMYDNEINNDSPKTNKTDNNECIAKN